MASENDHIKKESESAAGHKHPHNLIDDIVEGIQKLDTQFPLSGGETEEDFESATGKDEETDEKEHTKTSFREDLDSEFPLSGGEVER